MVLLLNSITMEQCMCINQCFVAIENDRTCTVELNELMMGQFPGGIRLSLQTGLHMTRILDVDFNGSVSFYEFMAVCKFMEAATTSLTRTTRTAAARSSRTRSSRRFPSAVSSSNRARRPSSTASSPVARAAP